MEIGFRLHLPDRLRYILRKLPYNDVFIDILLARILADLAMQSRFVLTELSHVS